MEYLSMQYGSVVFPTVSLRVSISFCETVCLSLHPSCPFVRCCLSLLFDCRHWSRQTLSDFSCCYQRLSGPLDSRLDVCNINTRVQELCFQIEGSCYLDKKYRIFYLRIVQFHRSFSICVVALVDTWSSTTSPHQRICTSVFSSDFGSDLSCALTAVERVLITCLFL